MPEHPSSPLSVIVTPTGVCCSLSLSRPSFWQSPLHQQPPLVSWTDPRPHGASGNENLNMKGIPGGRSLSLSPIFEKPRPLLLLLLLVLLLLLLYVGPFLDSPDCCLEEEEEEVHPRWLSVAY